MLESTKRFFACLLALLLVDDAAPVRAGQTVPDDSAQAVASIDSLGLTTLESSKLKRALDERDYLTAERLLLAQVERDPRSPGAARLLAVAGSVYFLNHEYLNAAIAWKKSEAITPLQPSLRFSLAMAYIQIAHPDWARMVIESLATQFNSEALYPYWLGRLDYDSHQYEQAIQHFQRAIKLAPGMARAYDNLGLCYYYQNENALAVDNYKKAIELERDSAHPSVWPYLNLAITLQFLNRLTEAEENLRLAIRLNPDLAQAHFHLGIVLEDSGRAEDAIIELRHAAQLDASYAEPHVAMARIYHKLGREQAAQDEVQAYLRLSSHSTP